MGYGPNIWKLKAIRALFYMHFFGSVLVPFYTQWGGLKLSQVLFLNSWFMFWNFALEIPTGTVADFFGRKASLMLGCAVGALAALVYVSRPSYAVFMAAETLFAVAFTLMSGADEALAYDSLAAEGRQGGAKRVLAALEAFKLAGIVVGTLAGGFMAARFGLRAPMAAYVVPALLGLALACTLREPPRGAAAARTGYAALLGRGVRAFFGNKVVWLLALEAALTNALVWGIIWLYQPLLAAAGMPVRYFGVVHALCALGQIALLANVAALERRLGGKRRLLLAMALAAGAALVSLAFTRNLGLVVAAIVLAFTFGLPRVPIFGAYINAQLDSEHRATALSVASMIRTLAIVVVNPLIGLAADASLKGTLLGLGVALLVATLFSRLEEHHLVG